jgi:hypothetical protein
MRVQIPCYTDRWMRGDRYGEIVKMTKRSTGLTHGTRTPVKIAHVKLDKSGKTIRVLLDDCVVVV